MREPNYDPEEEEFYEDDPDFESLDDDGYDSYDYGDVADRHTEIMERLDHIEELIESLKGK